MKIRQTTFNDLKPIMAIYDYARQFMKEHGNPNQWINGYPSEEYIQQEIADGHSYVAPPSAPRTSSSPTSAA